MTALPPWANGPFELILHAEGHLRKGDDFDRRITLISYDNSIEVSISTYLSLKPIQRGNRQYKREDVDKWLRNYHTKIDFLEEELKSRSLTWEVEKSHIIWVHDQRNEHYHGRNKGTPEKNLLEIVRTAALWIFSILFNIENIEDEIEAIYNDSKEYEEIKSDDGIDNIIDSNFDMIEIDGNLYLTSEVLFNIDQDAYREIGNRLQSMQVTDEDWEELF